MSITKNLEDNSHIILTSTQQIVDNSMPIVSVSKTLEGSHIVLQTLRDVQSSHQQVPENMGNTPIVITPVHQIQTDSSGGIVSIPGTLEDPHIVITPIQEDLKTVSPSIVPKNGENSHIVLAHIQEDLVLESEDDDKPKEIHSSGILLQTLGLTKDLPVCRTITDPVDTQDPVGALIHFKDTFPNIFAPVQPVQVQAEEKISKQKECKYFYVATLEEVEDTIRKHSEETFSHFVVAKKTKAYGKSVSTIDITTKFRIHWQSRDLTSTEECAVQIPFEGVPFIYIGEKTYMCHLGRSKTGKAKELSNSMVQIQSRSTKKFGCLAKIFVKQIAKFPEFSISNNTEYLRTQMSQKLRKALIESKGNIHHITLFIGTLPAVSEHCFHEINELTPVKEPIDPLIREKIIDLTWELGLDVFPRDLRDPIAMFVEEEMFKDKTPPPKYRRRYYPTDKDVANYVYKAKVLAKLSAPELKTLCHLVDSFHSPPNAYCTLHMENCGESSTATDSLLVEFCTVTPSSIVNGGESKIILCYQTSDQQRLLTTYGKHAILKQVSAKHVPFPLFAVFVPTNVDYQLVFLFIAQVPSNTFLAFGLSKLIEWNPSWSPKHLVVDYQHDHFSLLERIFPSCNIVISETSRNQAWKNWLENPINYTQLTGEREGVLKYLENMAECFSEETLSTAAQVLENSEVWKGSEVLRNWFSEKWLTEAKRWVLGYRSEEFMSFAHIPSNDLEDFVQTMVTNHMQHIKSKHIIDMVKDLVEKHIPSFYNVYIDRNIHDYRKQLLMPYSTEATSFLTDRPSAVVEHILSQLRTVESLHFKITQVQTGIFAVQNLEKQEGETAGQEESTVGKLYSVCFGNSTTLSSCNCHDWSKYKLPCVHMVSIFQNVKGWSMDMLSPKYLDNPSLSIDFSCFDRKREEAIVNSLCHGNQLQSVKTFSPIVLTTDKKGLISTVPLSSTGSLIQEMGLPGKNMLQGTETSQETGTVKPNDNLKSPKNSKYAGPDQQLDTLASDCNQVCEELTSFIQQVENKTMLQKVKLDLQFVLNDVKLELSKIPPNVQLKRHPMESSECTMKNEEIATKKIKLTRDNTSTKLKHGHEDDLVLTEELKHTEESDLTKLDNERIVDFSTERVTDSSSKIDLAISVPSEFWVYDGELKVKLTKTHRESILAGRPICSETMLNVQNILRHQFNDINGFHDFDALQKLCPHQHVNATDTNKVVQIHKTEGEHWAVSSRSGRNVDIYCCTLAPKGDVIQQVLKMVDQKDLKEKIVFIEQSEEEAERKCGIHAIAYCVSFAFDINIRDLLFDEPLMHSHLAECLEDMCFSMFPIKCV